MVRAMAAHVRGLAGRPSPRARNSRALTLPRAPRRPLFFARRRRARSSKIQGAPPAKKESALDKAKAAAAIATSSAAGVAAAVKTKAAAQSKVVATKTAEATTKVKAMKTDAVQKLKVMAPPIGCPKQAVVDFRNDVGCSALDAILLDDDMPRGLYSVMQQMVHNVAPEMLDDIAAQVSTHVDSMIEDCKGQTDKAKHMLSMTKWFKFTVETIGEKLGISLETIPPAQAADDANSGCCAEPVASLRALILYPMYV